MLWIIKSDSQCAESLVSASTLQRATRIESKDEREQAIRCVMNEMATDFQHKSWDYLSKLWAATRHLPLHTFDAWVFAVSEPAFLAALAVNESITEKDALLQKIGEELPIIWELVRVSDWVNALLVLKGDLTGRVDEEDIEIVVQILQRRIKEVSRLSPALSALEDILIRELFDEVSESTRLMQLPIEAILSGAVANKYEQLKREHADDEWPVLLSPQITEIATKNLPEKIRTLVPIRVEYRVSVGLLPIILAWRANTNDDYGWIGEPVNLFKLGVISDFDHEWFSTVYGLVTAWIHEQVRKRESQDD